MKEFCEFLKENDAYDSYFLYLRKSDRQERTMNPENYIFLAFDWINTKEGTEYWAGLDEKWDERLQKIRKPIFYLARDKDGELWLYTKEPVRQTNVFLRYDGTHNLNLRGTGLDLSFPEVTWENSPKKVTLSIKIEEKKDKDR